MEIPVRIYEQALMIAAFTLTKVRDVGSEDLLNIACDVGDFLASKHGYSNGEARVFSADLAQMIMREWEKQGICSFSNLPSYTRNAHSCVGGELP